MNRPSAHAAAAATHADGFLALCRPGFEAECAQELAAFAGERGVEGYARTERGRAYVEFVSTFDVDDADAWRSLVFARQVVRMIGRAEHMSRDDRLAALLPLLDRDDARWCDAWVESPDSDSGRELAALCRGLNAALVAALKRAKRIDRASTRRLHVLLSASDAAIVGDADVASSAPWPGGIPRLRFPRGAPSRSTLKLEEAFLVLLDEAEREKWLRPGMSAVDLGAAPGGWTYQLVRRSIRTIAVDNGAMDAALLDTGIVEHRRADGFRYVPPKPVDWLVCDMVEQPRRVAALIGAWLAERRCRRAMFNLKLPMKKRYDEVALCLDIVRNAASAAAPRCDIRAKQLYHDREEITVLAAPG